MTNLAHVSEKDVSHGKISSLDKGLTVTGTTIANVLEDGVTATLLFEDGSVLGPTDKNEIVIKATSRLTGVIIKDSAAFDGQWQVASAYAADEGYKVTLRSKSDEIINENGSTTWTYNLILELQHPLTRTRELYLHRVTTPELVEDTPPAPGALEAFLALISDRNESTTITRSRDFFGASFDFGPVGVDLEWDVGDQSLKGTLKLLGYDTISVHMKLGQATDFNLPDVGLYRKIHVWIWISSVSVDLEIRYEEFKFPKYVKKHREREPCIRF
ncbi:hypothetical protein LTR84_005498 [Exophiala bonariae]|uniref:Arrestin-like N-terminal domain-containing protein n=1 Tax=Exophiala bonariae TaxID=1690606 RepID=A0AAV9N4S2_9EURO|nr:hypothetical protein LTR84_005498 [Exophiala bonariae]